MFTDMNIPIDGLLLLIIVMIFYLILGVKRRCSRIYI